MKELILLSAFAMFLSACGAELEDEQSQDLAQRKDGDFASKLYQILIKVVLSEIPCEWFWFTGYVSPAGDSSLC